MNVQKIFDALEEDQDNSALGILCQELENQGYIVQMDDVKVTSDSIFDGAHQNIENKIDPINISLLDGHNQVIQTFSVKFSDYHEICICR